MACLALNTSIDSDTVRWFERSRPGRCQTAIADSHGTYADVHSTCALGVGGRFGIASLNLGGFLMAAEACLLRCHECAACKFVSVSKRDCWWSSRCDRVETSPLKGHRFIWGRVYAPPASPRVLNAMTAVQQLPYQLQQIAGQACRGSVAVNNNVLGWLSRAVVGHCGITTSTGCGTGKHGSFHVPLRAWLMGWTMATHNCLSQFHSCPRCRFVTVSVRYRDCSWYEHCPNMLAASGFLSAVIAPPSPHLVAPPDHYNRSRHTGVPTFHLAAFSSTIKEQQDAMSAESCGRGRIKCKAFASAQALTRPSATVLLPHRLTSDLEVYESVPHPLFTTWRDMVRVALRPVDLKRFASATGTTVESLLAEPSWEAATAGGLRT